MRIKLQCNFSNEEQRISTEDTCVVSKQIIKHRFYTWGDTLYTVFQYYKRLI